MIDSGTKKILGTSETVIWHSMGEMQTCLLGSKRMVKVWTRKGSNGGSSGFTGRNDENGTLTWKIDRWERRKVRVSAYATDHCRKLTFNQLVIVFLKVKIFLTLQNPTFVLIRAKYSLLWDVSAEGPASRIITNDLPFPPTLRSKPSYLTTWHENQYCMGNNISLDQWIVI